MPLTCAEKAGCHHQPYSRPFAHIPKPTGLPFLHTTFAAGDIYSFAPQSTEAEIHKAWIEIPAATNVACGEDGRILGTYYIKPNQPSLGSHVCNCGYIVSPEAQGQGVASTMCEHSQTVVVSMGFRTMQFNLVMSPNERAIRLWKKLGFSVVGTLPRAFHHQRLGYVDALVMFKELATCPPGRGRAFGTGRFTVNPLRVRPRRPETPATTCRPSSRASCPASSPARQTRSHMPNIRYPAPVPER